MTEATTFDFTLTVTDPGGLTGTNSVTVTVEPPEPPEPPPEPLANHPPPTRL